MSHCPSCRQAAKANPDKNSLLMAAAIWHPCCAHHAALAGCNLHAAAGCAHGIPVLPTNKCLDTRCQQGAHAGLQLSRQPVYLLCTIYLPAGLELLVRLRVLVCVHAALASQIPKTLAASLCQRPKAPALPMLLSIEAGLLLPLGRHRAPHASVQLAGHGLQMLSLARGRAQGNLKNALAASLPCLRWQPDWPLGNDAGAASCGCLTVSPVPVGTMLRLRWPKEMLGMPIV